MRIIFHNIEYFTYRQAVYCGNQHMISVEEAKSKHTYRELDSDKGAKNARCGDKPHRAEKMRVLGVKIMSFDLRRYALQINRG